MPEMFPWSGQGLWGGSRDGRRCVRLTALAPGGGWKSFIMGCVVERSRGLWPVCGSKGDAGGSQTPRLPPGFFFEPTVFTDVQDHMFIAREESFGPVMIISRFANG